MRRRINRIAVDDKQRVDFARAHLRRELGNIVVEVRNHGLDQVEGRAARAQRLIHRVDERVRLGGLVGSNVDERAATIRGQIGCEWADPRGSLGTLAIAENGVRQRRDNLGQIARPRDEAMVSRRADQGRRRLDCIDAAHFGRARRIAPRGEIARITQMPGRRAQEIAIDRENRVRGVELEQRVERTPVGERRPLCHIAARRRLEPPPTRLRIGFE